MQKRYRITVEVDPVRKRSETMFVGQDWLGGQKVGDKVTIITTGLDRIVGTLLSIREEVLA